MAEYKNIYLVSLKGLLNLFDEMVNNLNYTSILWWNGKQSELHIYLMVNNISLSPPFVIFVGSQIVAQTHIE